MSFETLRGLNGWTVEGIDDVMLLDGNPSLFHAMKNNWKLTLHKTIIVDGFEVNSPPSDDQPTVEQHPGLAEWRLNWSGYDVARGRSLEDILSKTARFMRYK